MVMERLHVAKAHPKNQDPVRQFAIVQAVDILKAAKIIDPGPKTESPSAVTPAEASVPKDPKGEMSVVFGCSKDQIAKSPDEINDTTKAYVGSLVHRDNNGAIIPIFKKIGHLEHIYTSYPEGRIRGEIISIGGKTPKELQEELRKRKINISPYAEDMMKSKDFTTLKKPEDITLLCLKVQYLELEGTLTTDEVYARAQALGLELCPAEAGPHKRLEDAEQPLGDFYFMAMKLITDRDGDPRVFLLERNENGLWLNDNWANPTNRWNPENDMVFSLSKNSLFPAKNCIFRRGFSCGSCLNFYSILQAFCQLLKDLLQFLRIACWR